MIFRAILISCCFASVAVGQADLRVTAAFDSSSVLSGTRIILNTTVQNLGPNEATTVELRISPFSPSDEPEATAQGWSCSGMATSTLRCVLPTLASGEAAEVKVSVRPRGGAGELVLQASAQSSSPDPTSQNNVAFARVPIIVRADVVASVSVEPANAPPAATIVVRGDITNAGPSDVGTMEARFMLPTGARLVRMVPNGSRWFCGVQMASQPEFVGCATRQPIYSGVVDVPILLEITAPAQPGDHDVAFVLFTASGTDPDERNNVSSAIFRVSELRAPENPTTWLLVPIYAQQVPGAFGSVWSTELRVLNSGDTPAVLSLPCATGLCFSYEVAARQDTEPVHKEFYHGKALPLFYQVETARLRDLTFQLRVFDESRMALNWGTYIPVVDWGKDSAGRFWFVRVPASAPFRHSVRLYTFSPVPVTIRVRYYNPESHTLIAERALTLQGQEHAQLDSLNVSELRGLREVRIEAVADQGSIWAMVSITNEDTQVVTILPGKRIAN